MPQQHIIHLVARYKHYFLVYYSLLFPAHKVRLAQSAVYESGNPKVPIRSVDTISNPAIDFCDLPASWTQRNTGRVELCPGNRETKGIPKKMANPKFKPFSCFSINSNTKIGVILIRFGYVALL